MSAGLELVCLLSETKELKLERRRQGESYGLAGGVGFLARLFQKLSAVMAEVLAAEVLFAGRSTLADQKLVSLIFLPFGRSRIKRPSCSRVQNPLKTALEVQIYVFCFKPQSQNVIKGVAELTGRSSSAEPVAFPRYFASAHSYITIASCPCDEAAKLTMRRVRQTTRR